MGEYSGFTFGDKTARHLAVQPVEKDNYYEDAIVRTAQKLCREGKGHYLYGTQWSSGTCLWHPGSFDKAGVSVKP